jgi:hypothetical protein
MSAWARHGECNHCGHCCTYVAREVLVRTPAQIQRDPAFYQARGFAPMEVDGAPRHVLWAWLYAPCPQHVEVCDPLAPHVPDRRCAIESTKPPTCVAFPRLPQDIVGTPCSYWFEKDGHAAGGQGSPHPVAEAELLALEET